jgi:xanthine dehydrogenase accessory factor
MKQKIMIWNLVSKSLCQNIPVMLLYVLESRGSSPGRQGFSMAVNLSGEMEGSIGGGIMEHKFVETAKERLKNVERRMSNDEQNSIRKQVHDKSAAKDQSGMICSGEQTILLYEVKQSDLPAIESLLASLEKNENGMLQLSPGGIKFSAAIPAYNFLFQMKSEEDWIYEEKMGYKNQLSVIGGGHCALAFSKLMSGMDFYIRVYDERKNLKTMNENNAVHEKHIVSDYSELKQLVNGSHDHYLVIMTFGYRTDDIALRALMGKEFKYMGLLGSRAKIAKMFDDYKKEGISDETLQRIHSPVGLAIKSQTPEEIAVSIAAEIIKVKNADL